MLVRQLDIQRMTDEFSPPDDQQLQLWVETALQDYQQHAEVVIRLVNESEITQLNHQYRYKQDSTNILSFPFEPPEGVTGIDLIGDLVICNAVLALEAKQQHKLLAHHWAHIVIHGVLHLLGYDHIDNNEAQVMEQKEIQLLQQLKIDNPYQEK